MLHFRVSRESPDVEAGAEERKAGGLGIFLVRQLAREAVPRHREIDERLARKIIKKLSNSDVGA